jgi:hypothetical protein
VLWPESERLPKLGVIRELPIERCMDDVFVEVWYHPERVAKGKIYTACVWLKDKRFADENAIPKPYL